MGEGLVCLACPEERESVPDLLKVNFHAPSKLYVKATSGPLTGLLQNSGVFLIFSTNPFTLSKPIKNPLLGRKCAPYFDRILGAAVVGGLARPIGKNMS